MEDDAAYCPRCKNTDLAPFETTRCSFCNAEIAVGTVVCPHCHRIQPPDRTAKGDYSEAVKNDAPKAVELKKETESERPYLSSDEEDARQEVRSETVEKKSHDGTTIIYNQIYTTPSSREEKPFGEGIRREEDDGSGSLSDYHLYGTPTIVGVDKDGNVRENKRPDRTRVERKTKIKEEKVKPEKQPIGKRAVLSVLAATLSILLGIAACFTLIFIRTDVMKIGGYGVALLRVPFIGVYSNFDLYAEKTQLKGMLLSLYNVLPYVFDGAIVVAAITFLSALFNLSNSPAAKRTTIAFALIGAVATLFIIGALTYIFDIERVGACLYVLLFGFVATIVLISVGLRFKNK